MRHPHHVVLALLVTTTLLGLSSAAPAGLRAAPPVADFPAPMSAAAARAQVQAAQRSLYKQRIELTGISADHVVRAQTVYFPQTGHHLGNRSGFLDFWRANGQLLLLGYPISEELVEDGRIVQYFERARLEYFPELAGTPYEVQLALAGSMLTRTRGFQPVPDPGDGSRYFPESGHTLRGEFRDFWERRGGLAQFGYPISEPFEELNYDDGQMYTVQYFERARFEYNPGDLAPYFRGMEQATGINLDSLREVRLGHLGRMLAVERGVRTAPVERLPGVPDWAVQLWERRIEVSISTQQLYAYEDDLLVYQAPVATGRDGFNTPQGDFAIYTKLPMQDMAGSAGGESWYVPNIPSVMYVVGGVALHGTYWHDAHGTGVRMSHGCINLRIDDAEWLYDWADIGVPVSVY